MSTEVIGIVLALKPTWSDLTKAKGQGQVRPQRAEGQGVIKPRKLQCSMNEVNMVIALLFFKANHNVQIN